MQVQQIPLAQSFLQLFKSPLQSWKVQVDQRLGHTGVSFVGLISCNTKGTSGTKAKTTNVCTPNNVFAQTWAEVCLNNIPTSLQAFEVVLPSEQHSLVPAHRLLTLPSSSNLASSIKFRIWERGYRTSKFEKSAVFQFQANLRNHLVWRAAKFEVVRRRTGRSS